MALLLSVLDAMIESVPNKSWILQWDGVFDDSVYVQDLLSRKFGYVSKDKGNIWICVLDKHGSTCAHKIWTAWVYLKEPMTIWQMTKHMLGEEHRGISAEPMGVPTSSLEQIPTIPQEIIENCIEGQPYVQHGIPVRWEQTKYNTLGPCANGSTCSK